MSDTSESIPPEVTPPRAATTEKHLVATPEDLMRGYLLEPFKRLLDTSTPTNYLVPITKADTTQETIYTTQESPLGYTPLPEQRISRRANLVGKSPLRETRYSLQPLQVSRDITSTVIETRTGVPQAQVVVFLNADIKSLLSRDIQDETLEEAQAVINIAKELRSATGDKVHAFAVRLVSKVQQVSGTYLEEFTGSGDFGYLDTTDEELKRMSETLPAQYQRALNGVLSTDVSSKDDVKSHGFFLDSESVDVQKTIRDWTALEPELLGNQSQGYVPATLMVDVGGPFENPRVTSIPGHLTPIIQP